jgi:Na+/H+-translocating membrane pyrophosphatase
MTEETHPILGLTEETLEALLKRAIRNTLLLGLVPALILLVVTGWRDAAMLVTGALISAASIFEWLRLARLINAHMRKQKAHRSAIAVVIFFVFRLTVFAGAIYGSLKCFQGSPMALLCGLSLAVATLLWEAVRMLKE